MENEPRFLQNQWKRKAPCQNGLINRFDTTPFCVRKLQIYFFGELIGWAGIGRGTQAGIEHHEKDMAKLAD